MKMNGAIVRRRVAKALCRAIPMHTGHPTRGSLEKRTMMLATDIHDGLAMDFPPKIPRRDHPPAGLERRCFEPPVEMSGPRTGSRKIPGARGQAEGAFGMRAPEPGLLGRASRGTLDFQHHFIAEVQAQPVPTALSQSRGHAQVSAGPVNGKPRRIHRQPDSGQIGNDLGFFPQQGRIHPQLEFTSLDAGHVGHRGARSANQGLGGQLHFCREVGRNFPFHETQAMRSVIAADELDDGKSRGAWLIATELEPQGGARAHGQGVAVADHVFLETVRQVVAHLDEPIAHRPFSRLIPPGRHGNTVATGLGYAGASRAMARNSG